jgi:hypothetical protein
MDLLDYGPGWLAFALLGIAVVCIVIAGMYE